MRGWCDWNFCTREKGVRKKEKTKADKGTAYKSAPAPLTKPPEGTDNCWFVPIVSPSFSFHFPPLFLVSKPLNS